MIAPPPGTPVLALFPGVTGPAYQVAAGEPGGPIDMLPVILPGGHRIEIPGVEGVGVFPYGWATKLAEAVLETVRLWDPSIDVSKCPDCGVEATGVMCQTHQEDQARSDEYRQILGWLADMGIEPYGSDPEAAEA